MASEPASSTSDTSGRGTILAVSNLSKTFVGQKALDDVTVRVESGQVVALVGQNGSGKSTLIKVLAGFHQADPGATIEIRGERITGTLLGNECLHFIHQDLALVNSLSTMENLELGRQGGSNLGPLRRRDDRARSQRAVRELGADFDVTAPVSRLAPAERAIVAIARALDGWQRRDNVLVLDEPTARLHRDEARRLFQAVNRVTAAGGGVIFVSHRLDEVVELADRVYVLSDGKITGVFDRGGFDQQTIVRLLAGPSELREPAPVDEVKVRAVDRDQPRLEVTHMTARTLSDVSFSIRPGEIVGVSGLLGSGMETLCPAIFGQAPAMGGVAVDGKAVGRLTPLRTIRSGIAYIPPDRRASAAFPELSMSENVSFARLSTVRGRFGNVMRSREDAETRKWISKVEIRPPRPRLAFERFSGGNQQKIVMARSLRLNPKVLLLDEPTQGVDVGAKAVLHKLVIEAAESGTAVLVSSTDTKELVTLCHRILVMRDGVLAAELTGDEIDEYRMRSESLTPTHVKAEAGEL